jgi:hypothetical protein
MWSMTAIILQFGLVLLGFNRLAHNSKGAVVKRFEYGKAETIVSCERLPNPSFEGRDTISNYNDDISMIYSTT